MGTGPGEQNGICLFGICVIRDLELTVLAASSCGGGVGD